MGQKVTKPIFISEFTFTPAVASRDFSPRCKEVKHASDSSLGLRIGLEGEREFKRAITDINRSMRVLGSKLKLVTCSSRSVETRA